MFATEPRLWLGLRFIKNRITQLVQIFKKLMYEALLTNSIAYYYIAYHFVSQLAMLINNIFKYYLSN